LGLFLDISLFWCVWDTSSISWLFSDYLHYSRCDTICDLDINTSDADIVKLKIIVSFNMHGFNQGIHAVRDMVLSSKSLIYGENVKPYRRYYKSLQYINVYSVKKLLYAPLDGLRVDF